MSSKSEHRWFSGQYTARVALITCSFSRPTFRADDQYRMNMQGHAKGGSAKECSVVMEVRGADCAVHHWLLRAAGCSPQARVAGPRAHGRSLAVLCMAPSPVQGKSFKTSEYNPHYLLCHHPPRDAVPCCPACQPVRVWDRQLSYPPGRLSHH